jgi:hypothetical protein
MRVKRSPKSYHPDNTPQRTRIIRKQLDNALEFFGGPVREMLVLPSEDAWDVLYMLKIGLIARKPLRLMARFAPRATIVHMIETDPTTIERLTEKLRTDTAFRRLEYRIYQGKLQKLYLPSQYEIPFAFIDAENHVDTTGPWVAEYLWPRLAQRFYVMVNTTARDARPSPPLEEFLSQDRRYGIKTKRYCETSPMILNLVCSDPDYDILVCDPPYQSSLPARSSVSWLRRRRAAARRSTGGMPVSYRGKGGARP